MANFDSYDYRSFYDALGVTRPDSGGIIPGGMVDAWKVYGNGATAPSDSGLINHVRKTVKVDAYGNPVYPSTFPARPEVPFQNNTRLAGRLPSIPLNIEGATGVAASDWFAQPGSYINQMGEVKVTDLPSLNPAQTTAVAAIDPAQAAIDAYMANPPDFQGRDKGSAPLGVYGGGDKLPQRSRLAAVAPLLNVMNRSGTTNAGYTYNNGKKTGVADWAKGLTPAQQYALANQFAALNVGNATGVLPTGGVFQNGIKVGNNRPAGVSAATAYDNANTASKANAVSNSSNPSKTSARASLASQWGFD